MTHYVWQMNDGSWQVSRTTNSKAPLLACEDHGYETKRGAMGALDYAKDCHDRPLYGNGEKRRTWRQLDAVSRDSWERGSAPLERDVVHGMSPDMAAAEAKRIDQQQADNVGYYQRKAYLR